MFLKLKAEARDYRTDYKAAGEDAGAIVEAWNARLAAKQPTWFAPTIGAALTAGYPWLSVFKLQQSS